MTFFQDAACHCTSPRQPSSKHNRQLEAPMEAQETVYIMGKWGRWGVRGGWAWDEDVASFEESDPSWRKITITFIYPLKTTACLRNLSLCCLNLWTQLHNSHTLDYYASNCAEEEEERPPITLFSAWSGTRWLMFCHVKVDRRAENFHQSVQAFISVPSHLLHSAADLIFQKCKCSVFISPIHLRQ